MIFQIFHINPFTSQFYAENFMIKTLRSVRKRPLKCDKILDNSENIENKHVNSFIIIWEVIAFIKWIKWIFLNVYDLYFFFLAAWSEMASRCAVMRLGEVNG